jgi:nucleoside-diphosphate-sugar epimerase
MKVLVTGANGFVGAMLCRKLAERGDRVRGLIRKTSNLSLLEGVTLEKVIGTLEDVKSLRSAMKDIDAVYHTAASVSDWGTWDTFRSVNVDGTRHVLDAAVENRVRRFVLVSSLAVHSFIGLRDADETSPQLPTPFPYCQTKREAESLALSYHKKGKIEVVVIRPGDIYGPGDRVSLLKMAPHLEKGLMIIIGGGKTLSSFTYVENLADGIILAGTHPRAAGEAFAITDEIHLTYREYFDRLTEALDVPKVRFSITPWLAYGIASILEWIYRLFRISSRPPVTRYLAKHLWKDFHFRIDKAKLILGYQPRIGLDEAIRRTVIWYKQVVHGEKD